MNISVTSDIFRSEAFGCVSVAENRHWLFGFVCSALRRRASSIAAFAPVTEGGSFDAAEYARRRGLSPSPADWAMAASSAITPESENLFDQLTGSNLVFGFGLPPSLHELLDRHAIPYLDIEIDPVRFASELYLKARTNHATIARMLNALVVDNGLLESAAGGMRAFHARRDAKTVQTAEPFALFVGQSQIDLSLVTCGAIAKPGDYISNIAAQAGAATLFVKAHPYESDNSHLESILQEVPNARLTNENIYRLLADVNLQQVVSLSSSVLCEAQYFDVPSVGLIENDVTKSNLIPPLARKQFRVYSRLLSSSFLSLIIDAVNGCDGNLIPEQLVGATDINLRTHLGCSWGYLGT